MHPEPSEIKNIIYSPTSTTTVAEELYNEMRNFMPGEEIPLCQNMENLTYKLLFLQEQVGSDKIIVVFIITDFEELQELFKCRDLLDQIGLIFILPTNDFELAAKASELNPMKITFYHQEYSEVIEELLTFRHIV